jgi:hypothetical protein
MDYFSARGRGGRDRDFHAADPLLVYEFRGE